jgi:Leucine-rich repeat (LRR) protein
LEAFPSLVSQPRSLIFIPPLFSYSIHQAFLALPSRVEGTLPTELGLLANLNALYLYDMIYLRDALPSQFVHLSRLSNVYVTGSLSDEIHFSSILSCLPSTLQSLSLRGNNIIKQIPNELSSFDHLTNLLVYGSRLTGTLPSKLGKMTNLQRLTLAAALLSGKIPSEIGKLTDLIELDLSCNYFSDILPSELFKLSNLKNIDLTQNCKW